MAEKPEDFQQVLVHTGQHYDANMSRQFFEQLDLPEPDAYLGVGAGTHAEQTGRVMMAFEPLLEQYQPDWVFVVGDVNSTLAAAVVCAKQGVPLAHVEAGLRSFDRSMPEEINRLVTDRLAQRLFTPSRDADENLIKEGSDPGGIFFVGNVMIDSLLSMLPAALSRPALAELGLQEQGYLLVTLHRPNNVDRPESLAEILAALEQVARERPVIFPVHPRTRKNLVEWNMEPSVRGLSLLEPMSYLDFLCLERFAGAVLTDSGGIQEETSYLGIPCLTVRPNTERPVTIAQGTNRLVPAEREQLIAAIFSAWLSGAPQPKLIEGWDGHAAERIVQVMLANRAL